MDVSYTASTMEVQRNVSNCVHNGSLTSTSIDPSTTPNVGSCIHYTIKSRSYAKDVTLGAPGASQGPHRSPFRISVYVCVCVCVCVCVFVLLGVPGVIPYVSCTVPSKAAGHHIQIELSTAGS